MGKITDVKQMSDSEEKGVLKKRISIDIQDKE